MKQKKKKRNGIASFLFDIQGTMLTHKYFILLMFSQAQSIHVPIYLKASSILLSPKMFAFSLSLSVCLSVFHNQRHSPEKLHDIALASYTLIQFSR